MQARDRVIGDCKFRQDTPAVIGITCSGFGNPNHPRGAVEQTHTQPRFELVDGTRHAWRRQFQRPRATGKAVRIHDSNKSSHQMQLVHVAPGD